jgi:hypothetical protein
MKVYYILRLSHLNASISNKRIRTLQIINSIIIVTLQEFAKRSLFLERLVEFAFILSIALFIRLIRLNIVVFTIN